MQGLTIYVLIDRTLNEVSAPLLLNVHPLSPVAIQRPGGAGGGRGERETCNLCSRLQ